MNRNLKILTILIILGLTLLAFHFSPNCEVKTAKAIPITHISIPRNAKLTKLAWDLADQLLETQKDLEELTQSFDDLAEIKAKTELELMQENIWLKNKIKKLEKNRKKCLDRETHRLNEMMKGHPPSFKYPPKTKTPNPHDSGNSIRGLDVGC